MTSRMVGKYTRATDEMNELRLKVSVLASCDDSTAYRVIVRTRVHHTKT